MKKLFLLFAMLLIAVIASAENYILYTSTDGQVVKPNNSKVFGANIVSNSYENGQGKILFDREVTSIGTSAFYYCTRLNSVEIPNSVTTIGKNAFWGCSSLKSLVLGSSLQKIWEWAFSGCTALNEIASLNATPPIAENNSFSDVPTSCIIKVPAQAVGDYKQANGWKDFENIIGMSDDELLAIGIKPVAKEK